MSHETTPSTQNPLKKAIAATALLAVGLTGASVGVNAFQNHKAEYDAFHSADLPEQYDSNQIPGAVQDKEVVEVNLASGSTAWETVNDMAAEGKTDELVSMVYDQTQGQPGEAVVPADLIDPQKSIDNGVDPQSGLTEVSER